MDARSPDDRYRRMFAELGMEVIPLPKDAPRLRLPAALEAWYRVAAHDRVNRLHHRILDPSDLYMDDGYLVFAEEAQGSVIWGIRTEDASGEDPEVWQGQRFQDRPDEATVWYSEERPVSLFLVGMITWSITGHDPSEPTPGAHKPE